MKQARTTGIGVVFRAVLNFAIGVIIVIFGLSVALIMALIMILDRIGYLEAFGRALREGYGKNLIDTISLIESIGDVLGLVVIAICLGYVLLAKRKR